jgi:hypothetical protein
MPEALEPSEETLHPLEESKQVQGEAIDDEVRGLSVLLVGKDRREKEKERTAISAMDLQEEARCDRSSISFSFF